MRKLRGTWRVLPIGLPPASRWAMYQHRKVSPLDSLGHIQCTHENTQKKDRLRWESLCVTDSMSTLRDASRFMRSVGRKRGFTKTLKGRRLLATSSHNFMWPENCTLIMQRVSSPLNGRLPMRLVFKIMLAPLMQQDERKPKQTNTLRVKYSGKYSHLFLWTVQCVLAPFPLN